MDNNEFNTQNEQEAQGYAFQNVIEAKSNKRGFAIAALVLGIVSVVCCCSYYVSIILAVMAIAFSLVSRRNMGYFDSLAIAGLILGIIGVVFGAVSVVLEILAANGFLDPYLEEYYKMLEELAGESGSF